MTLPTPPGDAAVPDFVTRSAGAEVTGTVAGAVELTRVPSGAVPAPVAVFATEPASTSACRSVYVAVAVTVWPGASVPVVPDGHVP